jgi:hypothetical protein
MSDALQLTTGDPWDEAAGQPAVGAWQPQRAVPGTPADCRLHRPVPQARDTAAPDPDEVLLLHGRRAHDLAVNRRWNGTPDRRAATAATL